MLGGCVRRLNDQARRRDRFFACFPTRTVKDGHRIESLPHMYFWLDYSGIPGITVREANDEIKKAETLAALQAAVESMLYWWSRALAFLPPQVCH